MFFYQIQEKRSKIYLKKRFKDLFANNHKNSLILRQINNELNSFFNLKFLNQKNQKIEIQIFKI